MRYCLIPILAVAALTLPLSVESKSDSKSANTRTCRIVFPERPNDAPKVAYLYDGKENHQVRLPSSNFSAILELPSGELTVVMTSEKVTKAKNIPLGAPKLEIKENVRDFYIILSPDPANSALRVRMRLVNANDDKLRPGHTLWINSTDHRISAKLGEQDILVGPGSETVSKSPVSANGYYQAEFHYQPHAEGDFIKITEQNWWHDAKSRHLGFIMDSGGRLPKIFYYRDFRL